MRNLTALFLIVLVQFSFGTRVMSEKQKALFDESQISKLKSSNLGRAVLLLAQVHSKQANTDFNRLYDSLDQLADSLQGRVHLENDDFGKNQQQYESDKSFYTNQLEQYSSEIAQHQIDIRALTQVRISYESTLAVKKDELSETKKEKTFLENQLVIIQRKYEAQNGDFNEAISVLDRALELLAQARNQAFVQTNQYEYKMTAENIHKTLGNLQDQRIYYQPIAHILTQVTSGDFADQQSLTKAIKLLQEIRASLNDSRVSLQAQFENERSSTQQLIDIYNQKFNQVGQIIIPGLLDDIETKDGEILTKTRLLNDAQGNFNQAQQNLDSANSEFESRTNSHTELIQEYNRELQILGECIEALQNGGIKRS